ncbi:histidine phosphatase family protein [Streptomyces sp. NPDC057616]|uniref:histidine phosphatase family protein n=1 Tax=Streptomyces sp. NPDC057616 TaxID=3346183 RepID=UPI0036CCFDF2
MRTAEQIRESRPGWDLWRDGVVPGDAEHPGEQPAQVAARTDAVLDRIRPLLSDGDVAVAAHGHLSRVLAVRLRLERFVAQGAWSVRCALA